MQLTRYKSNMTHADNFNTMPKECLRVIEQRLLPYFDSIEGFRQNIRSRAANGGKLTVENELVVDVMYCACKMRTAGCTKEFIARIFEYNAATLDAFMKRSWWRVKRECDKSLGVWCGSQVAWDEMVFIAITWFGQEYYLTKIVSVEVERVKLANDRLRIMSAAASSQSAIFKVYFKHNVG